MNNFRLDTDLMPPFMPEGEFDLSIKLKDQDQLDALLSIKILGYIVENSERKNAMYALYHLT